MNIPIPNGPAIQVLSPGPGRVILLQNNSDTDIYIGPAGVTADAQATGGFKLTVGASFALNPSPGFDPAQSTLYAVHAAGASKKLTIVRLS